MVDDIRCCLDRLKEIALKPNPLSTVDYIDLLIRTEQNEAKPGFQDRVKSLQEIRKRAEITTAVQKGEYDPLAEHRNRYKETESSSTKQESSKKDSIFSSWKNTLKKFLPST